MIDDVAPWEDEGPALGMRYEESVIAQRLIGAAMRDPEVMRDLLALHVSDDDFVVALLRKLWSTCLAIYKELGKAEPMLVESSMIATGTARDDVRDLMNHTLGAQTVDTTRPALQGYVDHMRRRVANRRLGDLGGRIVREAGKDGASPSSIAGFVEAEVARIVARSVDVDGADAYEMGTIGYDMINSGRPPIETIPLGVPVVDAALGGGAPLKRLTIISAGTGVGKSTFAKHFIRAGLDAGEGVVYFGFETDREEMTKGLVELYAGMRMPNDPKKMTRTDAARLMSAADAVSGLRLWIEDEPGTVEEIAARIRTYRRRHGVRLFFIDYVQDVEHTQGIFGGERAQFVHISKTLRKLAKGSRKADDGVAIVGFSQVAPPPQGVKRQTESEDTAGSKQFAKDAAAIVIIERDKEAEDERRRNLNRVRLAKNRGFGTLVEAWMAYDHATTRLRPTSASGDDITTIDIEPLDVPYGGEDA